MKKDRRERRRKEVGYNGLARLGKEGVAVKDSITSFLGAFTLKQENQSNLRAADKHLHLLHKKG